MKFSGINNILHALRNFGKQNAAFSKEWSKLSIYISNVSVLSKIFEKTQKITKYFENDAVLSQNRLKQQENPLRRTEWPTFSVCTNRTCFITALLL